jgi:hypothetical protein
MNHVHDFNRGQTFDYPVNDDERQRWYGQFAGAMDSPLPPPIGKDREPTGTFINGLSDALCRAWVFLADVFNNVLKVSGGIGRPANLHGYERNISSRRCPTASCVKNSSRSS